MVPFGSMSVRRKLALVTLISSASAVLFAGGTFFIWDIAAHRLEIGREITVASRTIAENSTAPLAFADPTVARETLAILQIHPHVQQACLYTGDGSLFATYHRDAERRCPPVPADTLDFAWRVMTLAIPVELQGRRLGTLLVERDLTDLRDRLLLSGLILAALLVAATVLAAFIGARLQRTVSEPLLRLAATARAVSESKNYTLRALPEASDEVGVVVSAFNEMLDRVQETTTELSHANRLKDEFLATLSHELRTPLNAVLGWVRILRSADVPPDRRARALESMERNARLQARLIEDLLEVSRITTGKVHLQQRPTDLATVVDSAVDIVQAAASAKGIRLVTDIPVRPCMTMGDPDRLQQIVWNLLANAVKFTGSDGRVSVQLTCTTDHLLTVTDTGIGIDPAFLPFIFQPFRQVDGSPSREHGGLGLGLAIVQRLIELHGGTVSARSEGIGTGATFQVRLPSVLPRGIAIGHPTFADTAAAPPPRAAQQPDLLKGIDVLVVEDEEDARELLRTTLESYGATVRTASSAAEAFHAVAHAAPDVIVSDIGMASEDGYSMMRRLRAGSPASQVPAMALTAYASSADSKAAFDAGYQAHVAKPFEPWQVAEIVRSLAASRVS